MLTDTPITSVAAGVAVDRPPASSVVTPLYGSALRRMDRQYAGLQYLRGLAALMVLTSC